MRLALWNTAFLGDAVLTLPLVRAIRLSWPEAQLDMYLRKGLGTLLACQPDLTHVYEVGRAEHSMAGMLRLAHTIEARRYDIWIGAHLSPRSSIMALASRAAVRIGYAGAWHRRLAYTHTVDRRFGQLDEIERLLELLRPLEHFRDTRHDNAMEWNSAGPGAFPHQCPSAWPPAWPTIWPTLTLAPEIREEAAAFRRSLPSGPVLGLHPGSVWATKRWTTEGFAAIARKAVDHGAILLLFAGKDEMADASAVLESAGLADDHPQVRNLSGQLDLPRLAAHLALLDCYLSNDSGPMHLAWIQHVPVVAIFGPTVRSLGFFPRGDAVVLEAPAEAKVNCRPCSLHGPQVCPLGHHACMTSIRVEDVWVAVQKALFARTGHTPA